MNQPESYFDGRQDDTISAREDTLQLLMIRQLIRQLATFRSITYSLSLKDQLDNPNYVLLGELIDAYKVQPKDDPESENILNYICQCHQTSFGIDLDAFINYLKQFLVEHSQ